MADRQKKEVTPPPLLLMPAGGGLTLTPPDQPNILMPVIQSEPSLFGPEDEILGEADSFVGQFPPSSVHGTPRTSTLFQNSSSETFLQPALGTPLRPQENSQAGPHSFPMGSSPLPPTSQVLPPAAASSSIPPLPSASGLSGLYRKHGSSRYAAMPAGTYAGSGSSPAHLMSSPPAPTPFTAQFSQAATLNPSPMHDHSPATLPPQPSLGPLPGMGYVQNAVGSYVPVSYHWCFCRNIEGRDVWATFSMADNISLEDAYKTAMQQGRQDNVVVCTDGGRYDVNVLERRQYAIYWEEKPKVVRRCSWFFKQEGDNRYVPYEEEFARKLEEEYKTAVTSGIWHKPIQFDTGETIVMHNPNVMVHYLPSSQPDEWGNVQGDQQRPRVVKRGVADFETIEEGEARQVDHLVFVVHGIGSVCDLRFRDIIECVDDFRSISQSLLKSHFSLYLNCGRIGRVEFLPIQWHAALHGDATGIDKRLKAITLPSTAKLRNFVNDTLMDVLFYTSPTYCQTIANTVGSEINRLYDLFMSRNPQFQGDVSVVGHSLGSCILFDLLQHQGDNFNTVPDQGSQPVVTPTPDSFSGTSTEDHEDEGEEEEETVLSLEDLLAKVGLQEKKAVFEQEQIDMEALSMCSDEDLKEMGLPMGPRKKLRGLLNEEQNKKSNKLHAEKLKRERQERRRLEEKIAANMAAQAAQAAQHAQMNGDISPPGSSLTINYQVGVGGTGQASIKYPKLSIKPLCCFALGSPVGLFLSSRGFETIGEDFRFPTCQKYFNIFHPFDPVAYRLEPLINPTAVHVKPVLMPHHKGRKRLHLELKENLARMGSDIKAKIIDSLKSTWNSINNFARAHQSLEQQVESEMSQVVKQLEEDDRSSIASTLDDDIDMGQINEGRRVDYQLQERPIESFNDYMFSLTSHGCYWNSEDTVLLVLREIYAGYGISPVIPGSENQPSQRATGPPPLKGSSPAPMAHPMTSTPGYPPMAQPVSTYNPSPYSSGAVQANFSHMEGPPSFSAAPSQGLPPRMQMAPPSGPPPFTIGQSPRQPAPLGPPPMSGFIKKS